MRIPDVLRQTEKEELAEDAGTEAEEYLTNVKSVALDNFEARELTDMGEKNGK